MVDSKYICFNLKKDRSTSEHIFRARKFRKRASSNIPVRIVYS